MNKKRLMIIGGGFSNEREISIKSSLKVAKTLKNSKYEVFFVEIAKDGRWLLKNPNNLLYQSNKMVKRYFKDISIIRSDRYLFRKEFGKLFDVAFIALHGKYGEDGRIQSILEVLGIPYTGSGVLASALGMDKIKSSEILKKYGIKIPNFIAVYNYNFDENKTIKDVKKNIGFPCIVKPNESGSSIGITLVKNKKILISAIKEALIEDNAVIIQKYIKGREFTCGVMGNTNQTEIIPFPVVEIVNQKADFFDYNSKYFSKDVEEICPAIINKKINNEIEKISKKVHEILGCDGLTRSDFILSEKSVLYFLEINTIPGQTEMSLCPKEAKAAGLSFGDFLEKQIDLAIKRHGEKI